MTSEQTRASTTEPTSARPIRNGIILLVVGGCLWLYSTAIVTTDGWESGVSQLVAYFGLAMGLIGLGCLSTGVVRAARKIDELHDRYVEGRDGAGASGVSAGPPGAA